MEIEFLYEIFDTLPRQGPGDSKSTQKAYSFIDNLPQNPNLIDIGCGTGVQTIEIAKLSQGNIIGLDNYQPFLDKLERNANLQGVSNIKTINKSMFELDFKEQSFDIIWSEGAVYIYGYEKALEDWKKFIKNNGYFVVSEITWFKENPPENLRKYWENECPNIKTIEENIDMIKEKGFNLITHFKLPDSSWWENLYNPLEKRLSLLMKKYHGDNEKITQLNEVYNEIEMFRKYSSFYGYTFFVTKKI